MSLVYSYINPEYGYTSVWKVSEKPEFFLNSLACEVPDDHTQSEKRIIEWLSSRYLIQKCIDIQPEEIIKDEFGKPHIKNAKSGLSISHSNGYTAVAFHQYPIGVDIQTFVSKIYRIEKKFTVESEIELLSSYHDRINALHIIWTVKEAVFKLYGRKELPLIEGIQIESAEILGEEIFTSGKVNKNGSSRSFKARTRTDKSYFLSQAIYENN